MNFNAPQFAQSADGTSIAYYDHGGNGPDVLLGHASGFCAAVWQDVVELLTNSFHCVTYDTRGHGQSGIPQTLADNPDSDDMRTAAFDWQRLADDAHCVIEHAALNNPFGIGHSSGAAAQVLLAERSNAFRAMYEFEPVVFTFDPPRGPSPDRELAKRTLKRRTSFSSRADAIKTFSKGGPFVKLTSRAIENYVNYGFRELTNGEIELRLDPRNESEIYALATDHLGFQLLDKIECTVAIAHGATSKSFSEDEMLNVTERIENGRFESYAGAGHFAPLEDPQQFAQRFVTFANSISQSL